MYIAQLLLEIKKALMAPCSKFLDYISYLLDKNLQVGCNSLFSFFYNLSFWLQRWSDSALHNWFNFKKLIQPLKSILITSCYLIFAVFHNFGYGIDLVFFPIWKSFAILDSKDRKYCYYLIRLWNFFGIKQSKKISQYLAH